MLTGSAHSGQISEGLRKESFLPRFPVNFRQFLYNFRASLYTFFSTRIHFFAATTYFIEQEISSPATKVVFANAGPLHHCLKMWRKCNNGLYNTLDSAKCREYLLKGWNFNRRFAPGIYLGMAPVLEESWGQIRCGPIIKTPKTGRLDPDRTYALVMKYLDQDWRLDHQLQPKNFRTPEDMKILATEIARMHGRLKPPKKGMGTPEQIEAKLRLNIEQFEKALEELGSGKTYVNVYRPIAPLMNRAYEKCKAHFEERYKRGSIKRCHGDLKATNLWLCPGNFRDENLDLAKKGSWKLLALDCVDFNEDFCNIDTLSDVAMLAVEIEMRLIKWHYHHGAGEFASSFLDAYLQEACDDSAEARLLLEYYLTEKAMICAYMSILYDGLPTLGERYLEIAHIHAQKLEEKLASGVVDITGICVMEAAAKASVPKQKFAWAQRSP